MDTDSKRGKLLYRNSKGFQNRYKEIHYSLSLIWGILITVCVIIAIVGISGSPKDTTQTLLFFCIIIGCIPSFILCFYYGSRGNVNSVKVFYYGILLAEKVWIDINEIENIKFHSDALFKIDYISILTKNKKYKLSTSFFLEDSNYPLEDYENIKIILKKYYSK